MKRPGLLRAGSPRALVAMVVIAGLASACSLINKPDEIVLGSGGGGGGGTGANGGGGAPPECTENEECAALTTECATGECADGVCVATPQPAETACGPEVGDSCDLQDMCDGDGNCVANNVPNGTYCEDCPAGAPDCALCNDGVCADCTGDRATEKSFRAPLAANGWALTGGWGVYGETPPRSPQQVQCQDGIDNDGDALIDDQDPDCLGPLDPYEQEFFIQPACSDGNDNDADGFVDANDPDCTSPDKDYESNADPIVFDRRVLGTDGNRRHPYGQFNAVEEEVSTATSPRTVLPSSLVFRSWNMDEGHFYDLKAVQVSLDGSSFTTIARCENTGDNGIPFCVFREYRAADDWDTVTLPLGTCVLDANLPCGVDDDCVAIGGTCNNPFAGELGYVRFVHDSTDACCHWERGWYVDALNFAQDCACATGTDCGYVAGECAEASCDEATFECAPAAQNAGAACSLEGGSDGCIEPTCDAHGICSSNFLEFEADGCSSCEAGDPNCAYCDAGTCIDCPETQGFDQCNVFVNPGCGTAGQLSDQSAWTRTGGWQLTTCLFPNSVNPSPGTLDCFPPQPASGSIPHGAPVMGNDGVRIAANPYTFEAREIASGSFITSETVLPAQLTFYSWHQDRGGNDTFNLRDRKLIRASTDGGQSWVTILDCDANMTVPFCQPWTMTNTNRPLSQWDEISINVPANLVGETAMVEFLYDTVDSGQGWERGWFIDDLNIIRCDYVNPPWFLDE